MNLTVAATILFAGLTVSFGAAPAASSQPTAGPVDALAKSLLSHAGMSRGIVSLPRCGDGQLAMAIARNSEMLVHAMDADPKNVDALRVKADAEGLLTSRLYVETGSADAMPYADNLVDMVIFSGVADADLTGLSVKEAMRSLSPFRGVLLVGWAKPLSADGKLTKAALDQWVKALAVPDAKVWDDETGVWAMVRKPLQPGLEGWSHRYHGAGNNPVSADTTIKGPLMTQWMGLPLHEGWWGTTLVSDSGRIFTIAAARVLDKTTKLSLTARSVCNGSVLWKQELNGELLVDKKSDRTTSYNPARCCMVAAGQKLYLIDGDGVLILDGETGAKLGRIPGPKPGGQIKWIAQVDGMLAMLAGEPDEVTTMTHNLIVYPTNPNGSILAVCDATAKSELWRRQEKTPIDERMLAVNAGKIFIYAAGSGAFCLELKTGKSVWTNSDPSLLEGMDKVNPERVKFALPSQRGLIATDQGIILGLYWLGRLVVLSPDTGAVRCDLPNDKTWRVIPGYVMDGKWWSPGGPVDMGTGKSLGKHALLTDGGCGPQTACPGMMIGGFGSVREMATDKMLARAEVKAPCDMGTVVSDGMIVTPSSQCGCALENWGYRALAPAQGIGLDKIPDVSSRLVAGSKEPPTPLVTTLTDWPMYRANIARTGATPVNVTQSAPKERWRWSPAKPVVFEPSMVNRPSGGMSAQFEATPPIAAAGKVWIGDAAGVVRCIDGASGKQIWSFAVAVRLFAPPTLADGRLFFGSGDGWVFCLDATSGRELWRFRAAPLERRTIWFGQLISTWPVFTGVLVHEGVAYVAAGYQSINGVYVYALDAGSGKVVWENRESGQFNGPTHGSGAVGTMTVLNGKLWMAAGTVSWPASFDLKTGQLDPVPTGAPGAYGSEVAIFADRFLLFGGRRLISRYDERLNTGRTDGFRFVGLKDSNAQKPIAQIINPSTLPPVWDSELTVVTRWFNEKLSGWNTSKLKTYLDETMAHAPAGALQVTPPEMEMWTKSTTPPPMQLWGALPGPLPRSQEFSATVLAANAVLAAYAVIAKDDNAPPPTCQLAALDRTSGKELWAVPLPCEPIFNGICVDRDGQILVVLRDGSMVCYGEN